ncbi:hypothetical protein [Galbibacter marinus]|nr:hypothetical protein [Galbibacter marinus]
MTIDQFRYKVKHIEQTNPAPKGGGYDKKLRYYSKLCFEWVQEIPYDPDGKTAIKELRALTEKSLSKITSK